MIFDSLNELFFFVDFVTIILPALTAFGTVFFVKKGLTGFSSNIRHTAEESLLQAPSLQDALDIFHNRMTKWISKVIRMKRSSDDEECFTSF
ncbi:MULTISPECIES: hypothetical protein [Bacillus]|uniref:Uncharacterized protein n=2 Tax=Bacillus TaxID=1386 RepID=A0A0M4FTJ7_9BACI|nr:MULTISPECIES: hypothetical protein [Bacillus]ALC81505.1 hypothetical protein AM592_07765 [Bacillus gobiensis]MBP1080552.1 hypothetical protein [Bacillus capparidis]MED1094408.1 hypothetical protein [Bacillus capparidis]